VKKSIKIILIVQVLIFSTYIISNVFYANLQVASLSSFFIILGSFIAHKKLVDSQVLQKNYVYTSDTLDMIDDPHGLYDEEHINQALADDLDLKEIVKEEKAKIKTFSIKTIKEGTKAGVSVFRLVPYVFLVLGFIALKNNNILDISIYLPSLLVGIILGSIISRKIVA